MIYSKELEIAMVRGLKLIIMVLFALAMSSCGNNEISADVNVPGNEKEVPNSENAEMNSKNAEIKTASDSNWTENEAETPFINAAASVSSEAEIAIPTREKLTITEIDGDDWKETSVEGLEVNDYTFSAILKSEDQEKGRLQATVKYPQIRSNSTDYASVNEKLKDIPFIIANNLGYKESMSYFEKMQSGEILDDFDWNNYYEIIHVRDILLSVKFTGSFQGKGQTERKKYEANVTIELATGDILPLTDFIETEYLETILESRVKYHEPLGIYNDYYRGFIEQSKKEFDRNKYDANNTYNFCIDDEHISISYPFSNDTVNILTEEFSLRSFDRAKLKYHLISELKLRI